MKKENKKFNDYLTEERKQGNLFQGDYTSDESIYEGEHTLIGFADTISATIQDIED